MRVFQHRFNLSHKGLDIVTVDSHAYSFAARLLNPRIQGFNLSLQELSNDRALASAVCLDLQRLLRFQIGGISFDCFRGAINLRYAFSILVEKGCFKYRDDRRIKP